MKSTLPWAVLRDALEGYRKVVAAEVGVTPSAVDRWCAEPADADGCGMPNPLQRLAQIVISLQRRNEVFRAERIIRAFAQSVGYVAIPMIGKLQEVDNAAIGELLRRTGTFVKTDAEATSDGTITRDELAALYDEATELLEQQQVIVESLRQQVLSSENKELLARVKPNGGRSLSHYVATAR